MIKTLLISAATIAFAACQGSAVQNEASAEATVPTQAVVQAPVQTQAQAPVQTQAQAPVQAPVQAEVQAPAPTAKVETVKMAEAQQRSHIVAPSHGSASAPAAAGPNAVFNTFLSKYVVQSNGINLVRYADVSAADKAALEGYIAGLSASGAPSGSKEEIMAYWFNLYNAETIRLIVDNYPLTSIKQISGPWKKKRLTVAGKPMSLNNIEHDTVRARYNEPRVHYAFNCASIGCPNVKSSAWEAATLDADLTQAAKDFIASPRGVSIDEQGRVDASSIFKWYKKDFGGNEQALLNHFAQYASGAQKAAIQSNHKIDDFSYNWSLNIAK